VSGLEVGTCDELPNIDNLLDSLVAEHARSHAGGERTIRDIIKYGSPVGQRSGDFNRVIWSLAGTGHSIDKIEERLVQYPDGIAAKYAGRLREEIERCYAKWESAGDTGTTGAIWDDPDWSLLDDRRGTLPEFPAGVLSDKWEEWLARAAHGAGVTHGHVAVPLLATVASLIGTACRIRPSRSWSEPFTLWTAIVGFSGSGKTAGMTGGFQPDKLARSFKGESDGMHARVLFAWPEEPAFHSLTDDVTEIEPELLNALCRIVDLSAGEEHDVFAPRDVRLSADARTQFEQFRQFQHRGKDALDGREREWWAKGPSQVLRLGGTLCYLDWAMEGGPEPQTVEVRFIDAAVRLWRDYLWPHSPAAVRQIGLTDPALDQGWAPGPGVPRGRPPGCADPAAQCRLGADDHR
jgi:hypothetical protein